MKSNIVQIKKPNYSRIEISHKNESIIITIPSRGLNVGQVLFYLQFLIPFDIVSGMALFTAIADLDFTFILFTALFFSGCMIVSVKFLFDLGGFFTLKINKSCCYAIWSISKLTYKKSVDRSQITDIVENISYRGQGKYTYNISLKYGKEKRLKLFWLSMTENEMKWLIREIKYFLNLGFS